MGEEKLENSRAERRKAHKMQMSSSSKKIQLKLDGDYSVPDCMNTQRKIDENPF